MVQNPPEGVQNVIPYLLYDDAPAAIEFLCRAFGFTERFRMEMGEGRIGHAELAFGDSIVMLATVQDPKRYGSPRSLDRKHALIAVYVDDVLAHHRAALAAGAEVLEPPMDQFYGDRTYKALDSEGNDWFFLQHIEDVDPAKMVPGPPRPVDAG